MRNRADLLIRCLRLEVENRAMRGILAKRWRANDYEAALIIDLRERENWSWPQIGDRIGASRVTAWRRYRHAKERHAPGRRVARAEPSGDLNPGPNRFGPSLGQDEDAAAPPSSR
jgi:hypothetical protein